MGLCPMSKPCQKWICLLCSCTSKWFSYKDVFLQPTLASSAAGCIPSETLLQWRKGTLKVEGSKFKTFSLGYPFGWAAFLVLFLFMQRCDRLSNWHKKVSCCKSGITLTVHIFCFDSYVTVCAWWSGILGIVLVCTTIRNCWLIICSVISHQSC